jgi:hypothetical protein
VAAKVYIDSHPFERKDTKVWEGIQAVKTMPSLDIRPQHFPLTFRLALSFGRFIDNLPLLFCTSYTRPARHATLVSRPSGMSSKEGLHTAIVLWIILVKVKSGSLCDDGCIRRAKYERVVGP